MSEPNSCVVLACRDLLAGQAFFTALGFRLQTVFPADAPRELELSGFGLRLCLQHSDVDGGGHVRLAGEPSRQLLAPSGARVEFVSPGEPPTAPNLPVVFAVHRVGPAAAWHEGRAGMFYRDLLPDRLAGTTIVSHLRIPRGGPVPDYVHFHRLRAQAIYVVAGWVRVVYEDQGDAFVMHAGDCVLQPPTIRHRVLDCSDAFEAIEVASPAEHVTVVDHDLQLPTARTRSDRDFLGQRFHHHRASAALATAGVDADGFVVADCGVGIASRGAIGVRVLQRAAHAASTTALAPAPTTRLWLPLQGALTVAGERVLAGDTCVLPPHATFPVDDAGPDLQLLEFALRAS